MKFDIASGRAGLHVLFLHKEREALTWLTSLMPSGEATVVLSKKVPKYEDVEAQRREGPERPRFAVQR